MRHTGIAEEEPASAPGDEQGDQRHQRIHLRGLQRQPNPSHVRFPLFFLFLFYYYEKEKADVIIVTGSWCWRARR
jgi:hypothetical protein